MERDKSTIFISLSGVNFNSHAHVERDIESFSYIIQIQISTHTLTWSVTISADVKTVNNFISTHTLTWSVTIVFNGIIFQ